MKDVLYIINPAGQGGAGIRAWRRFKSIWPDQIDPKDVIVTEKPGHAREIAASMSDYNILAAVGGDGTVKEVMSGVMQRQGPQPKLAIIPGGTGNDAALQVGIRSVDDAVIALRDRHLREFDLLRVDCQIEGREGYRHAFLYGSVGLSPNRMVKPWMKRLLGPKAAYYLGTLLQIILYHSPYMSVHTEEKEYTGRNLMVIVGNAEWTGGASMRTSPGAIIDDGQMNITIVPSLSKLRVITKMFLKVATGTYINEPGISYFPGRKIQVYSNPPSALEIDGDRLGTTPATFTICPRALQVISLKQPNK